MRPRYEERITEADRTWREKVINPREVCTSMALSAAMLLVAYVSS